MNPLFLAHLLGDFLFQPLKLVKFKEKSNKGIAIHCLVHFILLLLCWFPGNLIMWILHVGIVAVHGIIDRTKISLQNRGLPFGVGFFGDQVLHYLTITIGMFLTFSFAESPMELFWKQPYANSVSLILVVISFISALYNIALKQKATLLRRDLLIRIGVICATFALFVVNWWNL